MNFIDTDISGAFKIEVPLFEDLRGNFFKIFHKDMFIEKGLNIQWDEQYYSTSHKNVVRGMHFQTVPQQHSKLITCVSGAVIDVVLDLRKSSSTYLKFDTVLLDAQTRAKCIYIPAGCAHGFLSLEDNTVLNYMVETVYSPNNDKGILWNSFGYDWQGITPILSKRDQEHPVLSDFKEFFD
ncbi:dTDP-4-dehydrorhamnose 3,5-epimerase family protein [Flavobacterium sp. ASW18X]|uniref:dTDP-4-dehydrorhamnose 3,5-epimerase family protein n=1 Tax=Flavobacterium sp. ASW18X TaxID=2572595 RepID=UPI0010ADEC57|nr:dTDP-4-dehydrorhamnose 3,5-epimerase family protein [Flavobacterium sp. ASW18X]TKD65097.1 dTDP-4-keto-6-deoxy-D-glucose epimerase [Flavobacterium sp. ASW18X]